MAYSDSGLPGILFSLLDYEEDALVIKHAQETITSVLMEMAADNLSAWLSLCKKILTVDVGGEDVKEEAGETEDNEDDDDDVEFGIPGGDGNAHVSAQPRWSTRVFAASCLRKIISECCDGDRAHFDLGLAREVRSKNFIPLL